MAKTTKSKTTTTPAARRPVDRTGRLDIAAESLAMHGLGLLGGMFNLPQLATAMQPLVHDVVRRAVPRRKLTAQELEHVRAMADTAGRVVVG